VATLNIMHSSTNSICSGHNLGNFNVFLTDK